MPPRSCSIAILASPLARRHFRARTGSAASLSSRAHARMELHARCMREHGVRSLHAQMVAVGN
eukprot:8598626-Pyramimonas_sp.AAC.1